MNNAGLRNGVSSQQGISDREELLKEAKIEIEKAKENVERIWEVKAEADIKSYAIPSKKNDIEKKRANKLLDKAIKAEVDAIKEQFKIEEELNILRAGGSITTSSTTESQVISLHSIVSDAVSSARSSISGLFENDVEIRYITNIIYDDAELIDNLVRGKDTKLSNDIRCFDSNEVLKDNTKNIDYLLQINFSFTFLIRTLNNMFSYVFDSSGDDDGGYGGDSNLIDIDPSNNGETLALLLGNITEDNSYLSKHF